MADKAAAKATKAKTAVLTKTERRLAEIDGILKRLYEDNVSGRLADDVFDKFLADFTTEKLELSDGLSGLRAEVAELERQTINANSFIKLAEQYGEITELTDEVARRFVERVEVHEAVKDESGKIQTVEIYLAFIGKYE